MLRVFVESFGFFKKLSLFKIDDNQVPEKSKKEKVASLIASVIIFFTFCGWHLFLFDHIKSLVGDGEMPIFSAIILPGAIAILLAIVVERLVDHLSAFKYSPLLVASPFLAKC